MKKGEEQKTTEEITDLQKDIKTSHKNDSIVKEDKTYTEEEVEKRVATAVHDALNSELIKNLNQEDIIKEWTAFSSMLHITSFKRLGFFRGILLGIMVYSGLIAIYTLLTSGLYFNPKGAILMLGITLAISDQTIRPIVLILESKIWFKTSGFLLILANAAIMNYVSLLLASQFNIHIIFANFYEIVFIATILLLTQSLVDDVVEQSIT